MGNMLKTMEKPARFAGLCAGIALGIAPSAFAAPIRDSGAAEPDRAARMAKFARP
jgi:hypothetical protein